MPAKLTQEDVNRLAEEAHANEQAEESYDELQRSRALTTPSPTAVTDPVGISGEFDQSDIALPFAKLLQKTSPETNEGHEAGHFFKGATGEDTASVLFVCLHIARSRTFYDGDKAKAYCESIDRRTGHPRQPEFAAELGVNVGESVACVSCPHSDDPQTEKLACKMDYTLTLYDLETEEPFMFRVRGSAMGRFKQRLVSAVVMGRKPPWFAEFEMTSVLKTNEARQSWFAPELKVIKLHTAEENAEWEAYAQAFGAKPVAEMVDQDDLPFE